MLEILDDIKRYGGVTLVIVSILAIFVSGIFFSIIYFVMDTTETAFLANDCDIQNNIYVSSCQDLWDISLYPFLALKELLIWFSFFFIFALVMGMLIVGYQSGKNPVLLGVLVVFIMALTYIGIEVANVYRSILDIEVMRNMLAPFTVYNNVMLNFPWFVFFVGLMSVMLSIVNYQRSKVNQITPEELSY